MTGPFPSNIATVPVPGAVPSVLAVPAWLYAGHPRRAIPYDREDQSHVRAGAPAQPD